MNRKFAVVTVGLGLVVVSALASKAYAESATKPFQTIIQKLATKFGLKEADVQSVFDQARSERQAQLQTKLDDKLSQAVKDGKITEVQKQAIMAKRKELQAKKLESREAWKSMTADQRRAAMAQQKTELEAWAKANGIDLSYLWGWHRGFMHGFRMGWHMK
ncbi:hypothetical protein HY032_02175 [Candidatus Gottesmanbacteria bacterium]|nr:hypothetical protein [Candidatus Gottesmanbacteria bacterium]